MVEKKRIGFRKFFLALLLIQCVVAFSRDFVISQRYSNIQTWVSDIVPASFGLIVAVVFNAAIVYGIYRVWKFIARPKLDSKKAQPAEQTRLGYKVRRSE